MKTYTKYLKYLKYIIEHKKNAFKTCWKRKLYIHAFTHDLSKFSPIEFIAYANYDFKNKDNNSPNVVKKFNKAWQHHKDHNKHHWNYWSERNKPMPYKYLIQMICDWEAMGIKFGDTAQKFYIKNYNNIELDKDSRICLECNLFPKIIMAQRACSPEMWNMNLKEIISSSGEKFRQEWVNEFRKKYDVDVKEVIK